MRRSIIVDTTARLVFHSAVVLSLYLLFAGHNQPGGGFVGGLVAGTALAVHYIAGGIEDVRGVMPVRPWTVLGGGMVVAASSALIPLAAGGAVLESGLRSLTLPLLGTVKITSALAFDTGVYIVVVGLVAMVLEAFGDEPLQEADAP